MQTTKRSVGLLGLVLSTLLAACGGSSNPPDFIPQFGVTERQLYEPSRNTGGVVPQYGSGAVTLQLESADAAQGLPMSGDTTTVGVDAFFFEILKDGRVSISLGVPALQVANSVELLNAQNESLFKVNAANPQASVWLRRGDLSTPKPRFQLRVESANGAVSNPHVFAWFGPDLAPTANRNDISKLSTSLAVQCENCNLSGALLGQFKLAAAQLQGSDLRNAWLVKVKNPDDLRLDDFLVFKLFWDGTQIAGADLSAANLSRTDLTGAILTGAAGSRANLAGTNFNYATLTGVNLDGASMPGANFNHAQASQVSWIAADLSGANLSMANASQGNFELANLTGANLTDTNLTGANLTGANLTGALIGQANFTRALLTGATWINGQVCKEESVGECR
jgi:uncharacterized protein YjbI with pentapeptide repeats